MGGSEEGRASNSSAAETRLWGKGVGVDLGGGLQRQRYVRQGLCFGGGVDWAGRGQLQLLQSWCKGVGKIADWGPDKGQHWYKGGARGGRLLVARMSGGPGDTVLRGGSSASATTPDLCKIRRLATASGLEGVDKQCRVGPAARVGVLGATGRGRSGASSLGGRPALQRCAHAAGKPPVLVVRLAKNLESAHLLLSCKCGCKRPRAAQGTGPRR